jgi:hypothetical protein
VEWLDAFNVVGGEVRRRGWDVRLELLDCSRTGYDTVHGRVCEHKA